MSQSAKFELAQEDPIWFLVRRLNHSAMTAWRSFYFILSVIVELLCGFYFLRNLRKYCFLAGSGRFIKYVVWTGNIHSEQDLNLSWRTHRISNQTPSALRHYCISESLVLSVSIIRSWIVVWLSSSFEKLNIFLYFGLSEGLTLCWIKVSEKCRSQQDSNLRRKTPSDYLSDALTTRPWLHDAGFTLFCRSLLNCCVSFTFSRIYVNTVFLQVPIGS